MIVYVPPVGDPGAHYPNKPRSPQCDLPPWTLTLIRRVLACCYQIPSQVCIKFGVVGPLSV